MSDGAAQKVFLGRQPILDRHQQLFAYELLFRSSHAENGNMANFTDGNQATATVISNTFAELSMADVLGNYRGFIKVDQGLLFSDMITALPANAVVLEILENNMPIADVVARCEQLRQAGFSLAVRERPDSPDKDRSLHKLARFIKVDISPLSPEKLESLLLNLKCVIFVSNCFQIALNFTKLLYKTFFLCCQPFLRLLALQDTFAQYSFLTMQFF